MYINQTGIKGSTFGDNANISINQQINVPKKNEPIPSYLPQRSKNFVGREDELAKIHAKLQTGQGVIVCAVEGMGGVGKTELALQYAHKYQQKYVAQYFLQVRKAGLAQEVITRVGGKITLPEDMKSESLEQKASWYWQNWLPDAGRILVILDDVPNLESIPDMAMPIDSRFQLLITTRERNLDLRFESVPLGVFSEKKSLELLRKIVGETKVNKELEIVEQICQTLENLPLAIELVGEYIYTFKRGRLTFADLQKRLHLADESLSRERGNRFYAYRGVEAAIQLSWEDLSTSAQQVGMLLGLFAHKEIQWELIEDITRNTKIEIAELEKAWEQLDLLHLIQPVDQDYSIYKTHALVHEFFRNKLLISDQIIKQSVYSLVLGVFRSDIISAKELIVSELEKFNPFFDNSIKSIDYARLIRESKQVWREGLGSLSKLIQRTKSDGNLPKIGAYIYESKDTVMNMNSFDEKHVSEEHQRFFENIEIAGSKSILYTEYFGEEYEEYFEIPREIVDLYDQKKFGIDPKLEGFNSFSNCYGQENLEIPLISECKKSLKKLSDIIGKKFSLPTNNRALIYENAWDAAFRLTEKYKEYYYPPSILTREIENRLNTYWIDRVRTDKLECLKIMFNYLKLNNIDEFVCPWYGRYSNDPQEVLDFVINVYQQSLLGYQEITEKWFKKFTNRLVMLNMFPIAISGVVIISFNKTPSIDCCQIPLKEGSSNQVTFKLAQTQMNEEDISILLANVRETSNKSISYTRTQNSHLFTPQYPVTNTIYDWLWNDLEKLKLVSGRFDNRT